MKDKAASTEGKKEAPLLSEQHSIVVKKSSARKKRGRDIDVIPMSRELMTGEGLFGIGDDKKRRDFKLRDESIQGDVTYIFDPLGAFELRLLSAIVGCMIGSVNAHSGTKSLPVLADDKSDFATEVWNSLGAKSRSAGGKAFALQVTRNALFAMMSPNASSGASQRQQEDIFDGIAKLQRVIIQYESFDGENRFSMNLIGNAAQSDDTLRIAMNPRLVAAVYEQIGGRFAMLSTHTLNRQLRSDSARILYHRLCAVINQGQTKRLTETTLMGYIWRLPSESTKAEVERRRTLKAALTAISKTTPAWLIDADPSSRGSNNTRCYTITRPRMEITGQLSMDLEQLAPTHAKE